MTDLLVADAAQIRTITFDRPAKRNALTGQLRRELCDLLTASDADADVRALIITGTDPAFTAGVDFQDALANPGGGTAADRNPGQLLRAMRTPVICAVNGVCVSGGLEIALSSTFIVASERATFADTHARLNVVPTWGLTALLPRAVGLRLAREMSITGRFVGAEEALRCGLVNHVVRHEELLAFTRNLVEQIADTPAVAEMLMLYESGANTGLDGALTLERGYTAHRRVDAAAFSAAGNALVADRREGRP